MKKILENSRETRISLVSASGVGCVVQVSKIECENLSSEESNGRGKDSADEYYLLTSLISSSKAFSVGFMPIALMAHPNSFVLMLPPPSTSNSLKAWVGKPIQLPNYMIPVMIIGYFWWLSLFLIRNTAYLCPGVNQTLGLAEEITRRTEDYISGKPDHYAMMTWKLDLLLVSVQQSVPHWAFVHPWLSDVRNDFRNLLESLP